jgi:DUF971 family protein
MIPPRLHNDVAARTLTLTWSDDQLQQLDHGLLRASCMCAACRAQRLKHGKISVDPARTVTAIHAQGYGLQLVFDDGHDRGIYPWQYLQQLATAPT